jgi:hypothetical protein
MRAVALVCLMLVGGLSAAQAVHMHGQWLPEHAAKAGVPVSATQLPGDEEHCLLCQVMHAALPVSMRLEPVRLALVHLVAPEADDRVAESLWHFALFSRPPPAAGSAQHV